MDICFVTQTKKEKATEISLSIFTSTITLTIDDRDSTTLSLNCILRKIPW